MTIDQPPRCIILDFDGVVVDSLKLHLHAWAQATEQVFKIKLDNPHELTGRATRTIAGILANRYGDPSLASTLAKVKQQILLADLKTLPLIPGARDLIQELRSRSIPFGIASNSRRDFVSSALVALNLKIPVVVTSDDVARPKPRPDIFWECARRLGIPQQQYGEVIIFEDSVHGIKAAIAAGMVPIGLTTESPSHRLLDAGARATCSDLAEALTAGWLNRLPHNT